MSEKLRVAVIHDWLTSIAGAEKVLEKILDLYPSADLFTLYADCNVIKETDFLKNRKITTSFIQNLPFAKKYFRNYLPLMPYAIEQFDLSNYEIVISSSHAFAKGVITSPDQLHISYIHSPIRYAWDLQHQYLKESNNKKGLKSIIIRYFLHKIRIWDTRTSNGIDGLIANSRFISKRIMKCYGKESNVIYPPVNINKFSLKENKENFYLTASRVVPYKKIDIIVEAFSKMPEKKLIVIGDGSELSRIKKLASDNITFLGYQSDSILLDHMQNAKAFVFAAEEDFGITPVEAQACGTPIIAYGKGGSLETVRGFNQVDSSPTGIFFSEQKPESIIAAIKLFEENTDQFKAVNCRKNAELFSENNFTHTFNNFIKRKIEGELEK